MTSNVPVPARQSWLRPQSGLLILGVDWLFFGAEVLTLQLGVVVASAAAFTVTTTGVLWLQRRGGDALLRALPKALFAGIVAGIPTSIGGTALGAIVLVLSGLKRLRR